MSHKKFILACLAISALPLLAGCGQGSGGTDAAIAASPPSNPNPTTDFSGLTQNWDKSLPSTTRFTVLSAFNNQAVRDNNTGLVWEQAPNSMPTPGAVYTWSQATSFCANKIIGGTAGWRLPSVIELKSVLDPSLPPPFVPASIFSGVLPFFYWSATASVDLPASAWGVHLNTGQVFNTNFKANTNFAWCVRGPMQESAY